MLVKWSGICWGGNNGKETRCRFDGVDKPSMLSRVLGNACCVSRKWSLQGGYDLWAMDVGLGDSRAAGFRCSGDGVKALGSRRPPPGVQFSVAGRVAQLAGATPLRLPRRLAVVWAAQRATGKRVAVGTDVAFRR